MINSNNIAACTAETDLAKLLDFSINNQDLDRLEAMLGEFNPLKVLGVGDYEIRHSNVLGWLLDPKAHHGLGDSIFKNILLQILKDNRRDDLPRIGEVFDTSYSDLEIMREYKNIDLLAVSQTAKTVLVIENKIHAGEEETQLTRYADIVKGKYPDYTRVHIFLTLDGADPKGSDLFVPFKHESIYSIVKSVTDIRRDYINAKVYDFIQQYLRTLEEKIMPRADVIEVCTKLYKEHKDSINMILQYGKPRFEPKHIREFHNRTKTESIFMDVGSFRNSYNFIPCTWAGIVPTTSTDREKYYISFQFGFNDYENHKINMWLYIGSFLDSEERERFVEAVDTAAKANTDCKLTVKKSSKATTTIFSKTISLKSESHRDYSLDDYDTVTERLIEEYNSAEVQRIVEVVGGVVQKFWSKE